MAKIIAVANQKGGVGKTTTCINLTCALHNRGRRVLLCDLDPQSNSTSGMGVDKATQPNVYDILLGEAAAKDAAVHTKYGDVIPSNRELSGASVELVNAENREYILKNALSAVRDSYDYIIIDCPPTLEMLTVNALCAADALLIPVQCEYFALEGLTDLVYTVQTIQQGLNSELSVEGIVMTMYDSRTRLSKDVGDELIKYFGDKVYQTQIPRTVRLSEAPGFGKPVVALDRASKGARAYLRLAKEFLDRQEGNHGRT